MLRWSLRATQEPSLLKPGPVTERKRTQGVQVGGFSIHACVRIEAHDTRGREKLVRYAARPPFSEQQLRLTEDDRVELTLRSPTKAGQKSITFHPVQFLRRLAWLVPPPHTNMVRYFGLFAATHKRRSKVVPSASQPIDLEDLQLEERPAPPKPVYRIAWAKLIAKVYLSDPEECRQCGGHLKPIVAVTRNDEARLELQAGLPILGARAPPKAA